MVYVAFVIDVFARTIVGWKVSTSMTSQFALNALEQAIWQRKPAGNKVLNHLGRSHVASVIAVVQPGAIRPGYCNLSAEQIAVTGRVLFLHVKKILLPSCHRQGLSGSGVSAGGLFYPHLTNSLDIANSRIDKTFLCPE